MVSKRKQLQLRLCRDSKIKQLKIGHVDVDRGICVPWSQTHRRVQNAHDVRLEVARVIFDSFFCPHRSHSFYIRLSHKNPTWRIFHSPAEKVTSSRIFNRRKEKRYCDGHTQRIYHGHVWCRIARKVLCTRQVDAVCTDVYFWHCRTKVLKLAKRQIFFTEKDSDNVSDY